MKKITSRFRRPENALRRQKKMKFLKYTFFLAAGVCIVGVFLWPRFFTHSARIIPQVSNIKKIEAEVDTEKKQLLNPKFEGETNQHQPFVVEAHLATQISPERIDLIEPKGILFKTSTQDQEFTLQAETGVLRDQNSLLELQGNVVLEHDGCISYTSSAQANLKHHAASGDRPTQTHCLQGQIHAKEGFELDKMQKIIRYKGRPHLILTSPKESHEKEN